MTLNSTESFYACLIELEQILDDLMTLNYEMQEASYAISTTNTGTDDYKKHDRLKDIIFESIVLKLYKLFEIHSLLGKCLTEQNKLHILKALQEQWKKISSQQKIIHDWRDGIVAHSRERAKDFLLYNELDPNYFDTIKTILKISRCAVIYLWAIRANLYDDYEKAWKMKDEKMSNLKRYDITQLLSELINSENHFFEETNDILKKNNLKTNIFCGYDKYPMNIKK